MTWNTGHDRDPETDPWEPVDKSDQEFRRRLATELDFEVPPAPNPEESEERRLRELAYIHANRRPQNTYDFPISRRLWTLTLFGIVCPIVLGTTALIIGGVEGVAVAVLTVCLLASFLMVSPFRSLLTSGKEPPDDGRGLPHDASHTQGEP